MQTQCFTTSHQQMAQPISEIHLLWKSYPNVLLQKHYTCEYVVYTLTWYGTSLQLIWICFPGCFPLPTSCLWQGAKWERKPWSCASADEQQIKHYCVISTFLVTNLKQNTIDAYHIVSSRIFFKKLYGDILHTSPYWKKKKKKPHTVLSVT